MLIWQCCVQIIKLTATDTKRFEEHLWKKKQLLLEDRQRKSAHTKRGKSQLLHTPEGAESVTTRWGTLRWGMGQGREGEHTHRTQTRWDREVKIQNLYLNRYWTNWWSLSGKKWGRDIATINLMHSSGKCTHPVILNTVYFSTASHIALSCGPIWKTHKTIECIILTNVYITWNTWSHVSCINLKVKI